MAIQRQKVPPLADPVNDLLRAAADSRTGQQGVEVERRPHVAGDEGADEVPVAVIVRLPPAGISLRDMGVRAGPDRRIGGRSAQVGPPAAVGVDQRSKHLRRAEHGRQHQPAADVSRQRRRFLGPGPDPDRHLAGRPWPGGVALQWCPERTVPGDVLLPEQSDQQVDRFVVALAGGLDVVTEPLVGLCEEAAPPGHDLHPAAAQHVDGCVVLGHPNRIEVTGQGHGGAEPQRRRPLADRRQHDRGSGQHVVGEMVFAEVDRGETEPLGLDGLVHQGPVTLRLADGGSGGRIGQEVPERHQPEFEPGPHH